MDFKKGTDVQPILAPHVFLKDLPLSTLKPVFITSIRMQEEQLWSNGLFQNIFILYKLFEKAAFTPFLLVDDNKKHTESKLYEQFRTIDTNEWAQKPFRIFAYIEMGMSCGPNIRKLFKEAGAKRYKLYLGNILNIDIETPMFHPETNFCHHMVGEIETILVSPHYDFHQEYAASINRVYPNVKIAPYVWEPFFVKDHADIYRHRASGPYSFTIIEPNISFQKCSLIPIMICEAFYRKNPSKFHEVAVVNGKRLQESAYFNNSILPTLDLHKVGKLHLLPRANTKELSKQLNTHIIIHHTINNDYNYIFFEHLKMGFPVIHNFSPLKDYGYYYEGNDIEAACKLIDVIITSHVVNYEAYKAINEQLFWNFSINNPANLKAWAELLENGI
jgi:hypothetical protein